MKLAENELEISSVHPEKAFGKAGCRVGDQVVGVDQSKIDSVEAFRTSLRQGVFKDNVSLMLLRGKKRVEVMVLISE